MEFGMFHEFPSLRGRAESEAFDEAMDQVDAAERCGLDVMWLAELHFEPRRSLLSAPLSIASAIAARTRRIKIGIAVQVLPLCHPLRLAEEAATVDQLSHGRLIFGVGRSGVAQTHEAYGVSYAESRDRFREILDIVERAWTEPSFSYDGVYHRFKNVTVVPRPYQRPTPPIPIPASTPDTFPAIGRRGAPIFASVRHTSWAALTEQIRTYHEAWQRASRQRPGLRLGADLHRRNRQACLLRAEGQHHALLPRAGEFAGRSRAVGRPRNRRATHAAGRATATARLRRGDGHQCAGGQPRHDRRKTAIPAGGNRPERDPCRAQLRRPDPARPGAGGDAPDV